MANTKVVEYKKKRTVGFSVETGIMQRFKGVCKSNGQVPSHIVQEGMLRYIKEFEK